MEAYLADITENGALRVAGADAERFLQVMCAGDLAGCSAVGGLSQGAFLTAQAEVIDIVSVLRTGDDEFLLTGSADNRAELFAWLSAHAGLADDAGAVFPDLSVEDASSQLGILLMAGAGARRAHEELAAACAGRVFFIEHEFDAPAYGVPRVPCWMLFFPVNLAAEVGEFLSAYPEFYVLDAAELVELLEERGAYLPYIHEAAYADAHDGAFVPYLRRGDGFVGAHALGRHAEGILDKVESSQTDVAPAAPSGGC